MTIVEDIFWDTADFNWEGNEYIWDQTYIIYNSGKYCFIWDTADFDWEDIDYTWDDFCIILGLVEAAANSGDATPWNAYQKLPKEEKEKVINLVVRIKGDKITQTKKKKKIKVTAKDIDLVISEVLKGSISIHLPEKD